jgi:periplasmic divalent cation tolerance protein
LSKRGDGRRLIVSDQVRVAFSTFPDVETARQICEQLVTEKFAACANILPAVDSIYRWDGKLEHARETLVVFKVAAERYGAFEAKLKSLHPYDVPEIVALDVTAGLPEYLRWVVGN